MAENTSNTVFQRIKKRFSKERTETNEDQDCTSGDDKEPKHEETTTQKQEEEKNNADASSNRAGIPSECNTGGGAEASANGAGLPSYSNSAESTKSSTESDGRTHASESNSNTCTSFNRTELFDEIEFICGKLNDTLSAFQLEMNKAEHLLTETGEAFGRNDSKEPGSKDTGRSVTGLNGKDIAERILKIMEYTRSDENSKVRKVKKSKDKIEVPVSKEEITETEQTDSNDTVQVAVETKVHQKKPGRLARFWRWITSRCSCIRVDDVIDDVVDKKADDKDEDVQGDDKEKEEDATKDVRVEDGDLESE